MKYDEFMERKRKGRLRRKMPRSGFAEADGIGLLFLCLALLLMICESNGWLP